jgi:hypothetical protein
MAQNTDSSQESRKQSGFSKKQSSKIQPTDPEVFELQAHVTELELTVASLQGTVQRQRQLLVDNGVKDPHMLAPLETTSPIK